MNTSLLICAGLLIGAMLLVVFIIPQLISLMNNKRLFDVPGGRKGHQAPTPTAGGIAIFMGICISGFALSIFQDIAIPNGLLLGMFVLFFVGLKDDLMSIRASHKLAIQFALACLWVWKGVSLDHFFEYIFGIEMPSVLAGGLSVLLILVLTNAYNMIDGINGLAGSIGLIACMLIGYTLLVLGEVAFAALAFAAAGSLVGFLKYNLHTAKIFMGDTGSLVIGFLLSSLLIVVLEGVSFQPEFKSMPYALAAIAVVFIPLFDLVQVFIRRLSAGVHPFSADRRHIHHQLLRLGMTHFQATCCLAGISLLLLSSNWILGTDSFWQGLGSLCLLSLGAYAVLQIRLHAVKINLPDTIKK